LGFWVLGELPVNYDLSTFVVELESMCW